MPAAVTPLANLTLGSNQATVTFSSIPNTYRDLYFVFTGRSGTSNTSAPAIRMNNDSTAANYKGQYFTGTSGSISNGSIGTANNAMAILDAATISNTSNMTIVIHIMDYSATDKLKTVITRYGQGAAQGTGLIVARWASTSAITTVTFGNDFSTNLFQSGATFALYGVSA